MMNAKIFILFTVIFSFSLVSFAQKKMIQINVASYNIRYDDKKDSVFGWQQRKNHVINLTKFLKADLVGIQEGLVHQVKEMTAQLGNFAYCGAGRDDGKEAGEFSAILYNKDIFELIDCNTFWLGPDPEKPVKGWDAALPRVCSWAKFRHKPTNRTFFHFNTHFDHIGEQARQESSKLIVNKIREIAGNEHVVLTGDFNAVETSIAYAEITGKGSTKSTSLNDAFTITENPPIGPKGTFSGFKLEDGIKNRIDYIFVKEGMKVKRYGAISSFADSKFPSDHLPILAEIIF